MANFATHFKVSVITSATLATVIVASKIATLSDTLVLVFIGSLAGLLPDLDADDSTSINWLFSILSIVLACGAVFVFPLNSLIELWGSAILIYIATQYIIRPSFEKLTIHRGSMHSLLAVFMYSILSIVVSLILKQPLDISLLTGLFILSGSLTHLILDECYSVDLANNSIKASFGSAIKPVELRYPGAVILQCIILSGSLYYLYPQRNQVLNLTNSWINKLSHLTIMPDLPI